MEKSTPFSLVCEPVYSKISLTQDYLECLCSSWLDMLLCIYFCGIFQASSSSCLFSTRTNLIHHGTVILHSLRHHCLNFLMSFGQCSNFGIFQHRNHDDLTASGRCHITAQQVFFCIYFFLKNKELN